MANDYAQKGFKVEGPNYGGTVHFDWGDVKISSQLGILLLMCL